MSPQAILNASELTQCIADLNTRYLFNGIDSIAATVSVNWDVFFNATFETGQTQAETVVSFIYGLDANNKWMVTCNRCKVAGGVISRGENYFQLTESGATILTGNPPAEGVSDYFGHVKYLNEDDQWVNVDPTTNVNSCSFPWSSFQSLYDDNCTAARPDHSQFSLHLHPICLNYSETSGALVIYPQSAAMSMSYNGTACLNNTDHGNLEDKAADYASVCPPICAV